MNRFVVAATTILVAMFFLGLADQAMPGALHLQVLLGVVAFVCGFCWPDLKSILR